MRIFGTLKSALVLAALFVASCADDAVTRQAKQQCQVRGLDAGSEGFNACVTEIREAIYVRWGRDRRIAPPG